MAPINGVFVNLETNPKKIIGFIVTVMDEIRLFQQLTARPWLTHRRI